MRGIDKGIEMGICIGIMLILIVTMGFLLSAAYGEIERLEDELEDVSDKLDLVEVENKELHRMARNARREAARNG